MQNFKPLVPPLLGEFGWGSFFFLFFFLFLLLPRENKVNFQVWPGMGVWQKFWSLKWGLEKKKNCLSPVHIAHTLLGLILHFMLFIDVTFLLCIFGSEAKTISEHVFEWKCLHQPITQSIASASGPTIVHMIGGSW